jgi:preprotein translocase subunit SecG
MRVNARPRWPGQMDLEYEMDLMLLGKISFWAQAGAVLFIIICILLIIVVLLQKGRGGGLSAAFGGAGGQSAFGSKTGDVFTWATIIVVGVFLIMAIVLTVFYVPHIGEDMLPSTSIGPTGGAPGPGGAAPSSPAGGAAGQPRPGNVSPGAPAGDNTGGTNVPVTKE